MMPWTPYNTNYYWRTKLSNWLGDEYSRLRKEINELNDFKVTVKNASPEERFTSSWKDFIYASDIVSGFDLLSQSKNFNNRNIEKGIDYILENRIYNKNAIYDELTPILKKIISQDIIDKIKLSSEGDLTIDFIFNQLIDLYALDYLDYEDLIVVYNDINEIFINCDQKEFRSKAKALAGLLKSQSQILHEHEQHKISLDIPLILHLREYLDLIYNIKNFLLNKCEILRSIVKDFKFYQDESRIRDKYIMLACQDQREQAFLCGS